MNAFYIQMRYLKNNFRCGSNTGGFNINYTKLQVLIKMFAQAHKYTYVFLLNWSKDK